MRDYIGDCKLVSGATWSNKTTTNMPPKKSGLPRSRATKNNKRGLGCKNKITSCSGSCTLWWGCKGLTCRVKVPQHYLNLMKELRECRWPSLRV
ncbi:uncharacterized protein LOC144560140 isoform X3 [Carex rostrata]